MALEEDLDHYADDYVDASPEPVRGSRRLLIIVLGVGCLALAVSNVVLAIRVTELRRALAAARATTTPATTPERSATAPPVETETPAPAASAQRPAIASLPSADRTPAAAAPSPSRRAVAPARPPERAASAKPPATDAPEAAASIASPATPSAEPEPTAGPPRASEVAPPAAPPTKAELPARTGAREQARVAAAARANPERGAAATASWMVQEYGRADAERRARAVADFYGTQSADGAYWQRVLAEIARR